jgi:hypothetical protein
MSDQLPSYLLGPDPAQEHPWLSWWYHLASPTAPKRSASFAEQERFRRGRTGSHIILALYVLIIMSYPAGAYGSNPFLLVILGVVLLALMVATVLNRCGNVTLAGSIVVVAFIAEPICTIVTTPGGLNLLILPLYGLLVLPLLCAVSFLPPWWVFVVAAGNMLFTIVSLTLLPRTVELDTMLTLDLASVVTPIVLSQIIVASVAYLWVQGALKALMRANHAVELARLEHDVAQYERKEAEPKKMLEASIGHIMEVHTRVANGDLSARVPLTSENVLWEISGSLNTLLARMQSMQQQQDFTHTSRAQSSSDHH